MEFCDKCGQELRKGEAVDILCIPVNETFRKWVFDRMGKLEVPVDKQSDFLRGCLVCNIVKCQDATEEEVQDFLEGVSFFARRLIGGEWRLTTDVYRTIKSGYLPKE